VIKQKFTRESRLLRPAEYKRVFKQPVRSGDNCFRILAQPNSVSRHRLGMAVSRKVCPRAVGRNRIKRLVRESFRMKMGGHETEQALDFVVLPTVQAVTQSNTLLDESLSTHWQKLIKKAASRNPGTEIPASTVKDSR